MWHKIVIFLTPGSLSLGLSSMASLPIITWLAAPQRIFLHNTLDYPWSQQLMGCSDIMYCIQGHGWVLGWVNAARLAAVGYLCLLIVWHAIEHLDTRAFPPQPPDYAAITSRLRLPTYVR